MNTNQEISRSYHCFEAEKMVISVNLITLYIMKVLLPSVLAISVLFILPNHCLSQEGHFHGERKKHNISYVNSLVFVPDAFEVEEGDIGEGELIRLDRRTTVQSLGFQYQYNFSPVVGVGFTAEFELAKYFVDDGGSVLARENVTVFIVPFYFEFLHHFEIFFGPGFELERSKNLWLGRLGMGYEFYIANGWWVAPDLSFDLKETYYNFSTGLKLKKSFGKDAHSNRHDKKHRYKKHHEKHHQKD